MAQGKVELLLRSFGKYVNHEKGAKDESAKENIR